MKRTFIFLIVLSYFFAGCASSQDTTNKKNMQVVAATFSQWSEPPRAGSDIPEKGVDLEVTVRNWPQEYKPEYIVYNGRKSLNATIIDSTESITRITGRIVRTSGVLVETSESIEASDRLLFTDSDGDSGYIEIKKWQRAKK